MSIPVHIVSLGARTPLGLQAASSAAAYRAGISATSEHPFMVDRSGDPMPCALDSLLDPCIVGADRLLELASAALREVCAPLGSAQTRLPVFLGLAEIRPGFSEQDVEIVRSGLARINGLSIDISEVRSIVQGHAAGLSALAMGAAEIQKGSIELCVVGGVDSYYHPDTLEWLDDNRQLVGTISRSAFVPGEGAGFCVLATERVSERLGLGSLMHVSACSLGREAKLTKTTEVCLGEGLTVAVQEAVVSMAPSRLINTVICDINGERYRGEEWGFVCLRLSQYFDDPTAYWSPADCWGDVGAASGPLFAALACEAASRGYAEGPSTLLWASSEGGQRAATILDVGA